MKIKNIKMYSLSGGKYVVSYFDPIKSKRIQKNFTDETKAKTYVNNLKAPEQKRTELDYLKTASTDTAVRVFLEQMPNSYFSQSPKLIREFTDFFSVYGVPRLTEENLKAFFIYLKNEHDWSDRSLLVGKVRLQGFFKFLIAQNIISVSPLDEIKFNRGAPYRRKPTVFNERQILEFIEAAKRRSAAFFYPIFLLVHETAAKTSDIIELRWKDINFKYNTLELKRSTELQPRSFTLSDDLRMALQKINRVGDYVFTNLENQPLKVYIVGRELKRFQRMCDFETTWGLRDLRFSFGINFLKRGGLTRELQKVIGHKSPYNTEEIYGRYERLSSNLSVSAAVQETGVVSRSECKF